MENALETYIFWCCSVTLFVGNGACSADVVCLLASRVSQSPMVYHDFKISGV